MDEKRERAALGYAAKSYKSRERLNKRQLFKEGLISVGFGVFAFLLGGCEMLFSTYPLGFALLSVCTRQLPAVFIGVVASSFSGGTVRVELISAYILIVIARMICRCILDKPTEKNAFDFGTLPDRIGLAFSENLYLRCCSGAVGSFFVGVYNVVAGGFRFYDLFGALFYITLVPAAVFLYSSYFIVRERIASEKLSDTLSVGEERLYRLACAALICSLIYALRGASIAGLSLPVCVAFFLTLYFSDKGALVGIAMGLVFGVAAGAPTLAPLYAFGAIACASLKGLSVFAASLAACVVGLIWGIYAGGSPMLATLFPALLTASMVYCTAERAKLFSDVREFFKPDAALEESCALGVLADDKARGSVERMKGISESFSALSEIFYNLSSKLKRPAMLDLRRISERAFDGYCPDCDEYDICFGSEYPATLEQMKRIAVQLHSTGRADAQKLNEGFRQRCLYCDSIVADANGECAQATKNALQNEKTEIFALDYDSIARILNDAIKENEDEYKADYAMGKRLSSVIADEGYGAHTVMVWGTRRKKILAKGLDLSENAGGVEKLRKKLEGALGARLEEPEFELAYGSVNMQTSTRRRCEIEGAFEALASADGGEHCGDTVSIFENGNGYLYALISDGMGTGQTAAFTSEMCNVFLRNMLTAGNRMETSLKMLNSVIRAKGSTSSAECSATVDLLEADLYSGEITLIKSGAAPTYVMREGNIFKLQAQSIPIGIMRALDAKQIKMSCVAGDVIVMVSDGVARGGDDCPWLAGLLSEQGGAAASPAALARSIVRKAAEECGSDDVSAVVLRVSELKRDR